MSNNSISITYPSIHPGTEKSDVIIHSGQPDLVKLFYENREDKQTRRFFITDSTVASLECMQEFTSRFDDGFYENDCLLIIGSGEKSKTIETVLSIVKAATDANFSRKDCFVGIVGGVICDLIAFTASIFKRGLQVQFVPTTLLAMVDSAIGGKTSCDFDEYKNIIGTFYPAAQIDLFPEFIQSLPEKQYNSGLAEAFKTGLLFDKDLYDFFKNDTDKILSRDKELILEIIKKSVQAKAKVVSKDFTEENIRICLSLGHTFGTALENLAGSGAITHGAAIAWGIGRSVELASKKDYCLESFKTEIFSILQKYGWDTSTQPQIIRGGGIAERLLTEMHKNKKNITDKVKIIIQKGITDTVIEEVEDKDILSVLK